MAWVNVSRDALEGVRTSLNQFKIEIEYVPFSMNTNANTLQQECESILYREGLAVDQLKQQILSKKEALQKLQNRSALTAKQLAETEAARRGTEQSLAGIEREINCCEQELSHLRAALSCGDVNEQDGHRQAVYAAEKQLSVLKGHECEAAGEHREQERAIKEFEDDLKMLEADIAHTESDIHALEMELSKKENKLQRLNMAYQSLTSELIAFTNSVSRFSQRALAETHEGIAGVDQCIQYIDDYLATNL